MALPFTKITEIPFGPVDIQVWGLMVAFGMLMGLAVSLEEAKRKGVNKDHVLDSFIWIVLSSLVGSRLFYVLLFWRDFVAAPFDVFKIWEGGLVMYGGIFGAILALWFFVKHHKVDFLKLTDTMAPGLALGIFFGRIGCYLIGDHIGASMTNDWFWGSMLHGEDFLRHEPSLYLSLNGLLMFLYLWSRRKVFKGKGQMTMMFFIWYGLSRFALDFFRSSDLEVGLSDPRYFELTSSQFISLLLLVVGLIYFNKFNKKA
jgi:phosphatidylglycerol:prolipoprotein diacylglycerol transferase